ncbi:MAG: hypothetical protein KKA64_04685 [Nanoarchaeota archaeon]|nr:hypothetical protein [Nanoarchaeota archaeon]
MDKIKKSLSLPHLLRCGLFGLLDAQKFEPHPKGGGFKLLKISDIKRKNLLILILEMNN